jgi:hypothetical protein
MTTSEESRMPKFECASMLCDKHICHLFSYPDLKLKINSFIYGNFACKLEQGIFIVTICYMLDGLGLKSWHSQDILFSTAIQTSPVAHPASYLMDTGCYLGVKKLKHEAYYSLPSLHLMPSLRKSSTTSLNCPLLCL